MIYILTHTDLDGVGAAAAYLLVRNLKITDASVAFVEPYNLGETLKQYTEYLEPRDTVAIMDLGQPGREWNHLLSVIQKITRKGINVEWYDHHVWDKEDIEKLRDLGVNVAIDRTTCAAGVVSRYSRKIYGEPNGKLAKYLEELESSICAADLWRWNHPLAPKLFRVVSLHGAKGDARRRLVLGKLVSLRLWDDELEEILIDYVDAELSNYGRITKHTIKVEADNCVIAGVVKPYGPPSNSFIGAYLLARFNADIAVIIRENGAISLRSRTIDVQRIAKRLGGGGHPKAAGAKIELGLLDRLFKRILPKRFTARVLGIVLREALSMGLCKQSSL
ncbi:MAG: DHHA1 domain-containing protein [Desulfurococcales archaeon]|nr:DHHA1 domain-containing protein [Desulfurococcales archaeon]